MDTELIKSFVRFCVVYASFDFLSLRNEDIICLLEECLVMAIFLQDNEMQSTIYIKLGFIHETTNQLEKAIESYEKCLDVISGEKGLELFINQFLGNCYLLLGKVQKAIECEEKCLNIAIETGNKERECLAVRKLCDLLMSIHRYGDAIVYCNRILSIANEIGDIRGEAHAMGCMGRAHQFLGNYQKTIECTKRYLDIVSRKIGDRKEEGNALGNLGITYNLTGQHDNAIKCYKEQLRIALDIKDIEGEANAYCNLRNALQSMGEYDEALEYHDKYLSIAIRLKDVQGQGRANGNLGVAYQAIGEQNRTIEYIEKSLAVALEIVQQFSQGPIYGNLGDSYHKLGQYNEELKKYQKQLDIALELHDRSGEGSAYMNIAKIYHRLGEYSKEIEYYKKCLAIVKQIGDRHAEIICYGNIGIAHHELEMHSRSIEYLEKAIDMAKEIGDRQNEAAACGFLGITHKSMDNYQEAYNYHQRQLSIAMEIGDRVEIGIAHFNMGICCWEGNLSDNNGVRSHREIAEDHFKKSVECSEEMYHELKVWDDNKIKIIDTFIEYYKGLCRFYIETGEKDKALLQSENGRSRALGGLLHQKYRLRTESQTRNESMELSEIRNMIRPTYNIIFYDVPVPERPFVYVWALSHGNSTSFVCSFFQKGIQDDKLTALTDQETKDEDGDNHLEHYLESSYTDMRVRETVQCEDRSVVDTLDVAVNDVSCNLAQGETVEKDKNKRKIARCIEDEENEEKSLEFLYEILVSPVEKDLVQDELIIIPDGPLFRVPFAALRDPKTGKLLSETKCIRLAPSLTSLKFLQESTEDQHYKTGALIVGNPEIGQVIYGGKTRSFTSLPGAEREAIAIGKLLGVKPLIGRQATKQDVVKHLKDGTSIIHFASHGESRNGQILLAPSRSSSSIPEQQEYILTMKEAQLTSGIRAQLVVLSCCHSGRGEIKSEGVVGMTRAFLAAGARAVVASLWAIDDDATMFFMLKFYSHLKQGESASRSLQQAMKEMRESVKYKEPKYWAAFFLIGDDVTIDI